MANTTFSGPVRSKNGFSQIAESSTTGALTGTQTLSTYTATVTVASGATTGTEASIGMPANFLPLGVAVIVTTAATNSVNLQDIGSDADNDGYIDGLSIAVNSTGFKGFFGCNGALTGLTGANTTADEVEVVVSGDPGASGVTLVLKMFGISTTADTE
jgi:enolase